VFRIKKKKETTLKQATKGLCHSCREKKLIRKKWIDYSSTSMINSKSGQEGKRERDGALFFFSLIYTHTYIYIFPAT
jgi:hypothetical protein